jgi:hypothetical protein
VLASPYAFAYPEWRETAHDIAERGYRSRSLVSFARKRQPQNLFHLPERSTDRSARNPFHQAASVIKLQEWKKKMGKEPNGEKNINEMDDKEVFMEIMRLCSKHEISSSKLREILEAVRKVSSKPDKD